MDNAAQQLQGIGTPGWLRDADQSQSVQAAAEPQAAARADVDPLSVASLSQTALGLVAVIALILIGTVLLKRYGPYKRLAGRSLKLVAGQNVGPRERVVVVEVEDTWLVLGVAQNNVNTLHKLPARHDSVDAGAPGGPANARPTVAQAFAENLRQAGSRWSRH